MSATKKPTRYWRYEVTDVWGTMEGKLEVGSTLIDRWKNPPEWHTINFKSGKEGGFAAKRLGEVTEPESLAQLAEHRRARLAALDAAAPEYDKKGSGT